ncbi:MAG: type II secretion system protein [Tissierellia bacterium]|nr:type II secretion system protein [Tissierellia bacterium]
MKKGFTLIELLLTMSIISVIFLLFYMIFSIDLKTSKNVYENSNVEKNALNSMMYVESQIRSALYIEEILDDDCNFFIINENADNSYSVFTFKLENNCLYRMSFNLTKDKNGKVDFNNIDFYNKKLVKNKISEGIDSIDFKYDKEKEIVNIDIMFLPKNANNLYESAIGVNL